MVRTKHTVFLASPKNKGMVAKIMGNRSLQCWTLDEDRLSSVYDDNIIDTLVSPDDDKLLREALITHLPDQVENGSHWTLIRAPFAAKEFYPRIYRPIFENSLSDEEKKYILGMPKYSEVAIGATFQLASLLNSVRSIFQVINPDVSNLKTYGTEIRNLLITASTEFETQCKGVMKANGVNKKNWSTRDYVKLLRAMKLQEYSVRISPYSRLENRKPFDAWDYESPSQSLRWYDAYNATKHDREANFHLASLENAIDAVGACAIMLFAQYGQFPIKNPMVDHMVAMVRKPSWPFFQSYFSPDFSSKPWTSISYNFEN